MDNCEARKNNWLRQLEVCINKPASLPISETTMPSNSKANTSKPRKQSRKIAGLLLLFGSICPTAYTFAADSPLTVLKTIRLLPRKEAEIATAHDKARSQACEHVPPGEPLEITSFVPEAMGGSAAKHELPVPTSRRAAFSVGLDMLPEDQAKLPALSRGRILDYLASHYVCVEARVQRDLDSGEYYLHHRPLAATTVLRGPRLTEDFTELVSQSVQDMRSLGLLIKGQKLKPEGLRTLVLVHKSMMLPSESESSRKPKPVYEYVFIRGRPAKNGLVLHAFATSEQRKRLNYLELFTKPGQADQTGIRGTIYFTEYKVANLLPAASVNRKTTVRAEARFSVNELDDYAGSQKWSGGWLDNVSEMLDAIIDRKVPRSR